MEWKYRVWGATHEAISKPSSEAQKLNSAWIKSRTGEDMGQFSAGTVNAAVPSFTLQIVWQEYMNSDGRHAKHLSPLKKSVLHLRRLRCL